MPETYKEYVTWEIALAISNNRDLASGSERTQEGDIVNVRSPHEGTGGKVRSSILFVLLEGLDSTDMRRLKHSLQETEDGTRFEKRRYCIPFDRLPAFIDQDRARDPDDIYQPFQLIDEDVNFFIETAALRPLRVEGLVFDKLTGKFL